MERLQKYSKKIVVGLVGGCIIAVGIIMIPYPGPGWLTVFAGLGILATEFLWARGVLDYGKKKFATWEQWLKQQSFVVKSFFWFVTLSIVIGTIWLLNGYGFINHFVGLHWDWLDSPLPFFEA